MWPAFAAVAVGGDERRPATRDELRRRHPRPLAVLTQQARPVDLQQSAPPPGFEQLEVVLDEIVTLGMGEDRLQPVRTHVVEEGADLVAPAHERAVDEHERQVTETQRTRVDLQELRPRRHFVAEPEVERQPGLLDGLEHESVALRDQSTPFGAEGSRAADVRRGERDARAALDGGLHRVEGRRERRRTVVDPGQEVGVQVGESHARALPLWA